MRFLFILLAVFLIGLAAWFVLRDDGVLDQVTEERVEQALLDKGAPPKLAECMAERLVDELSLNQLRKLENLRAGEGEAALPASIPELRERLERVDDPEAVRVLTATSIRCVIRLGTERLQ